jgi:nitrile hydratase accessory protein
MTRRADPRIAEMSGVAALPRKSGELVFHDEWEQRVFALAVALCEQGLYQWDEFRDHLIAEIAAADRAAGTGHSAGPTYYESWLAAFEKLVVEKGICTPEQLNFHIAAIKLDRK